MGIGVVALTLAGAWGYLFHDFQGAAPAAALRSADLSDTHSPSTFTPPADTTTPVTLDAAASPSPAATPSTPTGPPTLDRARAALTARHGAVVLVLGDASSDDRDEWAKRWGRSLSTTATVDVRRLRADTLTYRRPFIFGTAERPIHVYNASRRSPADWPAPRLKKLAPVTPDLVILNLGRGDTAATVAPRLTTTYDAVMRTWPRTQVVTIGQRPARGDRQAAVRTATTDWARTKRVPVIGITAPATTTRDPASLDARAAEAWARTVADALNP